MKKRSHVQIAGTSTWRTTCLVPLIDLTPALDWPASTTEKDPVLHALAEQIRASLCRYGLTFVHDARQLSAASADAHGPSIETGRVVCHLLELRLELTPGTLTSDLSHEPRPLSQAESCETWHRTACSEGMIIDRWGTDPGSLVIGVNLFRADTPDNLLDPVSALVIWAQDEEPYRVLIPPGFTLVRAGEALAEKTSRRLSACRQALSVTPGLREHYERINQQGGKLVQSASAVSLGEPVLRRSRARPVRAGSSLSASRRVA